jgi:hypothetical protein
MATGFPKTVATLWAMPTFQDPSEHHAQRVRAGYRCRNRPPQTSPEGSNLGFDAGRGHCLVREDRHHPQ